MCGGTGTAWDTAAWDTGLSPRVRGNPRSTALVSCRGGSIPACAGEPFRPFARPTIRRVYPRVCGGTRWILTEDSVREGLSPRVRGNLVEGRHCLAHRGSIPACAGEPPAAALRRHGPQGLSPRVRGNPLSGPGGWILLGSIPACAGEPLGSSPWLRAERVYPRVCGGTEAATAAATRSEGLSPRVRGNLIRRAEFNVYIGSIPACAGEPTRAAAKTSTVRVYPRVCGGTYCWVLVRGDAEGLSPRVRGNPNGITASDRRGGSIPACAGEPLRLWRGGRSMRVYPRVCGGTKKKDFPGNRPSGLSPRVRGNPQ